jgi:hypothetical protein
MSSITLPGRKAKPNTVGKRMARQAPAATTDGLVGELKADGEDEGQYTFEKRLTIAK